MALLAHQAALAVFDAEAALSAFAPDGSLREPLGPDCVDRVPLSFDPGGAHAAVGE